VSLGLQHHTIFQSLIPAKPMYLTKTLRKISDNRLSDSFASKMRMKRFALFNFFIRELNRPIRILDVGGTQEFWEKTDLIGKSDIEITLVNLAREVAPYTNIVSVIGDAKNLQQFKDKEFDIVFSNSVIEHLGEYDHQYQAANEIMRVGKRYFVQTPNKYFPLEPHFLFPFFQFLPLLCKVLLVRHFNFGWYRGPNRENEARLIRLLTEKELKKMFPAGTIYREKILGLTKSFIVYGGGNPTL